MTDRIMEEIRKALDAATPGPWEVTNLGDVHITKDYRMVDGRHIAMWIADMCVDRENEDQILADAHLIANAPEWLRWQQGEIDRLQEKVDSLLEEKEGWQVVADRGWHEAGEEVKKREELEFQLQQLRKELEQVKKERDDYRQEAMNERELSEDIVAERERLYLELAEKGKVLEWYADEDTHEIKRRVLGDFAPISLDKGQRARDILAKYKGGRNV